MHKNNNKKTLKKPQSNKNIIAEIKLTSENTSKCGRHPPLYNLCNGQKRELFNILVKEHLQ